MILFCSDYTYYDKKIKYINTVNKAVLYVFIGQSNTTKLQITYIRFLLYIFTFMQFDQSLKEYIRFI